MEQNKETKEQDKEFKEVDVFKHLEWQVEKIVHSVGCGFWSEIEAISAVKQLFADVKSVVVTPEGV